MKQLLNLLATNRRAPLKNAMVTEGDQVTLYIYDMLVSTEWEAEYYGGVCAQDLVPQIMGIKGGTIHLRINSPGGDLAPAQAICTALRQTGATVIGHVDGLAASAAAVITTACDEVEMSAGALFMIHLSQTMAYGDTNDMTASAALLAKSDGVLAAQFAQRTGKSPDELLALMAATSWFTAQEALDAGLINRIAESSVSNLASWDLTAFGRPPTAPPVPVPAAPAPAPAAAPVAQPLDNTTPEHRERQLQRLRVANLTAHQ